MSLSGCPEPQMVIAGKPTPVNLYVVVPTFISVDRHHDDHDDPDDHDDSGNHDDSAIIMILLTRPAYLGSCGLFKLI